MYVDPFVAGVVATIMVELVLVIGIALFVTRRKTKGGFSNGKDQSGAGTGNQRQPQSD